MLLTLGMLCKECYCISIVERFLVEGHKRFKYATWTRIFLKTEKEIFVVKNIRIRVSLKDHMTLFEKTIYLGICYQNNSRKPVLFYE